MKKFFYILLTLLLVFGSSSTVFAQTLGQRLSGKLLLQVQDHGRIWYVAPQNYRRYEVTFKNALPLFENFALGISNADLGRIDIDSSFAQRLQGTLLLQVQDHGRIWYVDFTGRRHEVTWNNLLSLFQELSLGISNLDLEKILVGTIAQTEVSIDDGTTTMQDDTNNSDLTVATGDSVLHNFVNDYRTKHGLSRLILDKRLCVFVDERLEEIHTDFSHAGFELRGDDGSFDFLQYKGLGENLFYANYGDETTAIEGWHNSPGHRENMQGDWTHACSKLVDGYGVSLFMKL